MSRCTVKILSPFWNRSDLAAWASRAGKDETCTARRRLSSSSTARRLHRRSASSQSRAARLSFPRHRSSDASLIRHLSEVSSAASSLMCAISSRCRRSFSLGFREPDRPWP
uniref:Uncharacterized protein n=1 Tax=Setaria italica TaxID=4555 RepID=K3YDV6_SETIT